jgi:hypothetical protein
VRRLGCVGYPRVDLSMLGMPLCPCNVVSRTFDLGAAVLVRVMTLALCGRMVDLTLFMLGHVPTGNLWKFISDDSGSNSVELLRQLGALTGRDDTHTMHSDAMSDPGAAERARDLLDAHGPALIRSGSSLIIRTGQWWFGMSMAVCWGRALPLL